MLGNQEQSFSSSAKELNEKNIKKTDAKTGLTKFLQIIFSDGITLHAIAINPPFKP